MLKLAARVAAGFLRLYGRTFRLRIVGSAHLETLRQRQLACLFAVWHGRMLVPILAHRDERLVGMVSLSKDGDAAASVLAALGYESVRGSSSKGGNAAYHALAGRITAGYDGAIIPDGPRGPAQKLKPGLLYLAQETGVPILPLSASARHARRFQSWDRFLLPLPFAETVLVYGAPFVVPKGLDAAAMVEHRLRLEAILIGLELEADALAGRAAEATPVPSPPAGRLHDA